MPERPPRVYDTLEEADSTAETGVRVPEAARTTGQMETRVRVPEAVVSASEEETRAIRRDEVPWGAAGGGGRGQVAGVAQPGAAVETPVAAPRRFDPSPRSPGSVPQIDPDVLLAAMEPAGFEQRYERKSVLGVGGMGEVLLCKDRRIGREVALKVMRDRASAKESSRRRFLREARIQGQLEHPAIVPVYDLGVDPQGDDFFTMKRIRGATLDAVLEWLRQGDAGTVARFSQRKLLAAFSSVCLAVDFAHRRGVLHRDLKPGNIILGDFGEVYVLDWGLARARSRQEGSSTDVLELTHDDLNRTQRGSLLGTPGYMSPEQARGQLDEMDARSDVYALGAILFEMVAGSPLHTPTSLEAVLVATMRGVDGRPSLRRGAEVPPELDAICARALALDPEARHGSARELSDAIEKFLDGDRDVQMRREMSQRHVAAARRAMEVRGPERVAANARALREVGSAIALDPGNAEALQTMAWLLTHVPDEVPPEAEAELAQAAQIARKEAASVGAMRYLAWIVFLPLALWMGVRSLPATAASVVAVVVCGVVAWVFSRRAAVGLGEGLALLLISTVAVGLMSALFGPFILVPGLVSTNTMFFSMNATPGQRRLVIALGVLALLVPWGLEALDFIPLSYTFASGAFQVTPRAVNFPPFQTLLTLSITNIAMVIIPGLLMGRMRDALALAERRQFLQSWHLRQLVPSSAQQAMAQSGPRRR